MGGHVGGYTAAQVVALRVAGVRLLSWRTLAGVAFSAATHAFIDRRWPVRWVLDHTGSLAFARSAVLPALRVVVPQVSGQFTGRGHTMPAPLPLHGPYLADQALHHACLFVSARIIAGRSV